MAFRMQPRSSLNYDVQRGKAGRHLALQWTPLG